MLLKGRLKKERGKKVKRYLENNGYVLSKGKQLNNFKLQFANDINVPSKTIGLFNFRAVLHIGILGIGLVFGKTFLVAMKKKWNEAV